MPRTLVTETPLVLAGGAETQVPGDTANGMYIVNSGDQVLHFINNSGSPITVTIVSGKTVQGLDIEDIAVVVPASGERFVKPLPTSIFSNSLGQVDLDLSDDTTFFIASLKV